MSGEIDFSFFIAALRRRWWIVLLSVIVALAIGVGIGLLQDRRYEASNVLLVQSPRYQWRFASEITAITDQRRDFQREVLAIARSDEIAQAAAAALAPDSLGEAGTAQGIKSAVIVRAGDGNTIVVTATSADPERAAAYARAWTAALISAARDIYGTVQDLASFEAELTRLGVQLQEKEATLAETRARTGLYGNTNVPDEAMKPSLTLQRLNRLNETLAGYLQAVRNLQTVQRELVEAGPDNDLAQLPWELLDEPVLSQRGVLSPEIARANLDDPTRLMDLLRQEESALQATADELSAQADQLQAALAADWQAFSNSTRELNQARDLYLILARKVSELQLQERLDPSLLSMVGSPEPLVTHVRAPMWGLLATAVVAGLITGVLLAVLAEQSRRRKAPPSIAMARASQKSVE